MDTMESIDNVGIDGVDDTGMNNIDNVGIDGVESIYSMNVTHSDASNDMHNNMHSNMHDDKYIGTDTSWIDHFLEIKQELNGVINNIDELKKEINYAEPETVLTINPNYGTTINEPPKELTPEQSLIKYYRNKVLLTTKSNKSRNERLLQYEKLSQVASNKCIVDTCLKDRTHGSPFFHKAVTCSDHKTKGYWSYSYDICMVFKCDEQVAQYYANDPSALLCREHLSDASSWPPFITNEKCAMALAKLKNLTTVKKPIRRIVIKFTKHTKNTTKKTSIVLVDKKKYSPVEGCVKCTIRGCKYFAKYGKYGPVRCPMHAMDDDVFIPNNHTYFYAKA